MTKDKDVILLYYPIAFYEGGSIKNIGLHGNYGESKKTRLRLKTKLKTGKFTPFEKGKFLALHGQGWKLSDIAKELSRNVEDLQEMEISLKKEREKVKRCKKEVAD